jgi:predicted exporter
MVPVAVIVASHMPSSDGRGDEGSGTVHDTATAEADLVSFFRVHLRIWLTAPLMPIATLAIVRDEWS